MASLKFHVSVVCAVEYFGFLPEAERTRARLSGLLDHFLNVYAIDDAALRAALLEQAWQEAVTRFHLANEAREAKA